MKNLWNLMGWNVTPYIGFKKKKQDFIMSDHVEPHPFTLEAKCRNVENWMGNANVCKGGISDHGIPSSQFYIGREDENGNIIKTGESVGSTNIPGYATLSNGENYVNLAYGDRIEDSDFCFHTENQDPKTFTCIEKGEGGINLLKAFGGVSQIHQRDGITHMYFVDWTGPFVGLNLERQFSNKEFFNTYLEYFKPRYKVWGNWPNRTDWMHDPSFIDSGGSGYGLLLNFNYQYEYKPNIVFVLGAEYEYLQNKDADTLLYLADGTTNLLEKSIIFSQYYSYGANVAIKIKW